MFRRVHLSVESFSRSLFVIRSQERALKMPRHAGEILLVCMLSFRFLKFTLSYTSIFKRRKLNCVYITRTVYCLNFIDPKF